MQFTMLVSALVGLCVAAILLAGEPLMPQPISRAEGVALAAGIVQEAEDDCLGENEGTDWCVGCIDDCLEPVRECLNLPPDHPDYCESLLEAWLLEGFNERQQNGIIYK